jgi:predicted naringenin-chalcone synthase
MSMNLLGLGTALPPARATTAQAARLAGTLGGYDEELVRLASVLYRRSGVEGRHTILDVGTGAPLRPVEPGGEPPRTGERMSAYDPAAAELAGRAARAALADAGMGPERITHLVTVSCTGAAAPGVDIALLRALPLRPDCQRTHVGFMGCHGALAGLRVARAFAEADPRAVVLLVAVELCSLHFHYGRGEGQVTANALFADGAAALVGAAGEGPGWSLTGSGSCLLPEGEDAMSWTIGDHGFRMTLSPRVPEIVARHLPGWLAAWLDTQGLSQADVQSWAVHPGGPRVLSVVGEALGLPASATEVSRAVLAEHGNMSSPTVLFVLQRLRAAGAPRPACALSFGPGLVVEAALWR